MLVGALVAGIYVFPTENAEAVVSYTVYPSHIHIIEYYTTTDQAKQACDNFVRQFNYSVPQECRNAEIASGLLWEAGWLNTHPGQEWNGIFYLGDFYYGIPSPKNRGTPDACVGNPIHAGIGNKFQVEAIYSGAGVLPADFSLYYNNSTPIQNANLGANWRGRYDRTITLNTLGGISTATVYRPDGKVFLFSLNTNNNWLSDADISDTFIQTATGWKYTTSGDEAETYDTTGKLLSITDRAGLMQALAYDTSGRLATVTDPFGRKLTFAYDASSRISAMTDPAGGVYGYAYDANNNLASVTYPDGKTRTYLYENAAFPRALTGIIDENGARYATWAYDAKGHAISSEHAGAAEKVTLAYNTDASGNPLSTIVTDPLGTARTYNFQTVLGVVKSAGQSQPGGSGCGPASSAIAYDANGNIASKTDFNGNRTVYQYDLARNLETSRTEAYGTPQARTVATQWHPTYRLPVQIAEPGRVTAYSYDAAGNLLQKTITAGGQSRTWAYTYNANGQVLTVDGPRTDVADLTAYTYDAQGNLASVTNPLGQVTRITAYDPHGRPLSIADPNGLVTQLAYDPRGRLTSRSVGGEVTTYQYDGVGQLTQVTQPDGVAVAYTYDAAHRLTQVADSAGNRIAYTLDPLGNRIGEDVYDPAGQLAKSLSRAYDALGRLQSLTGVAAE